MKRAQEKCCPLLAYYFWTLGKGKLPSGDYILKSVWNSYKGDPSKDGYCDPSGFCWVAPIEPDFDTTRSGFFIHPDGGAKGTLGCIGIDKNYNTLFLRNFIDEYLKLFRKDFKVEVVW